MTPVHHLLRLQSLAEQSGDAELATWFGDGLDAYLFADVPLEQALDLRADGRGKYTARRLYLLNQRNAAIRAAWSLCEAESPWLRSVALADQVSRFRAILWPRWRSLSDPPDNASDLRRHLFRAHRCGDVPASATRLHQIALLMQLDAA